jgi:hypothetical protein
VNAPEPISLDLTHREREKVVPLIALDIFEVVGEVDGKKGAASKDRNGDEHCAKRRQFVVEQNKEEEKGSALFRIILKNLKYATASNPDFSIISASFVCHTGATQSNQPLPIFGGRFSSVAYLTFGW